jgi:hypothetical protein
VALFDSHASLNSGDVDYDGSADGSRFPDQHHGRPGRASSGFDRRHQLETAGEVAPRATSCRYLESPGPEDSFGMRVLTFFGSSPWLLDQLCCGLVLYDLVRFVKWVWDN